MKNHPPNDGSAEHTQPKETFTTISLLLLGLLMVLILSCSLSGVQENQSAKETELELSVQQTILAQQQTEKAAVPATAQPVQQDTNTPEIVTTPGTDLTQTAQPKVTSTTEDLTASMKSANILLFEDIANRSDTTRYVKETLDNMGLTYKDDGGAVGWLKQDLLQGMQNGQYWDLIILSSEERAGVQGEFFDYVNDALDKGAAVILEVWFLNRAPTGNVMSLLTRCGIEFQADLNSNPSGMYALDPSNPILNEPNRNLNFTSLRGFWSDNVGDLVKKASSGDAKLLVGIDATRPNEKATIVTCMNNQFILQTFSTHNLSSDTAHALWENYIHNALQAHFTK